eukprot:16554-Heterococcus_DN1.PRE.1
MRPTSVPQLAPFPETVNNTIWEQRNFDEAAISDGYGTDDGIVVECSTSPDDNPLYEAGAVLGLVLDFVGPVYSSTCTERRAAFASTSRLLLADESGLDIDDQNNKALQRCAGLYASQRTLLQANQLGMNFNNTVVNAAAESGDLDKLQWLLANTIPTTPMSKDICDFAAKSSNADMLRWLREQKGGVVSADTAYNAAEACNWLGLQYLRTGALACRWDARVCSSIAKSGNLEMLKFVRELNCPLDQRRVTQCAAESGNVSLMHWLVREQGAQCGPTTMLAAVSSTVSTADNRLAMCKYLHYSNGCAWGRGVMNAVALRGDIELLIWLRSAGCPMVAHDATIAAVRSDNPAVLEFVLSQLAQPRTAEQLTVLLNVAGACDKLNTAQWLKQNYCVQWPAVLKWPTTTENHWSGSTLAWARQLGCASPLTWNICNRRFSQDV